MQPMSCSCVCVVGRGNYKNDVMSLVRMYREKIGDHRAHTSFNPLGGVVGVDIEVGDYRCCVIGCMLAHVVAPSSP